MAKKFPYDGQGLQSFPAINRTIKISVGYTTDNDVVTTTTGVYHLCTMAAGSVVIRAGAIVNTAFTGSVAITLGDSDDVDGYLLSTDIAPQTTNTAGALKGGTGSTGAGENAYASGKYYAASQTVDIVVSGATVAAGQADFYLVASLAGLDV
jgi:hypothetical protein